MSLIILIALALFIAFIIFTYQRLLIQIEAVKNNQKQINIQLNNRQKIFESLIHIVKKHADDQTILKEVVTLRSLAQEAKMQGDEVAYIDAENSISDVAAHLKVIFEQYPELKTNQSCLALQEDIVNTENKLAYAKQSYNDSIDIYNISKKSFPTNLIILALPKQLEKDFPYWQFDEKKMVEHESYTVQL